MTHELRVGDVVECVDAEGLHRVKAGCEYTIVSINPMGITLEDDEVRRFIFPGCRFRLLRRPVSADSPLCVGWYGVLRDGRRTDGALEPWNGFATKYPNHSTVGGSRRSWADNGECSSEEEADRIEFIIPPEAVEQEDEGPRWGRPHKVDDCDWLGQWGEYDLWHCGENNRSRFLLRDKNSEPYTAGGRVLYPGQTPSMEWHYEAIRRAKERGLIKEPEGESEADKLHAEIASLRANLEAERCEVKELRKSRRKWRLEWETEVANKLGNPLRKAGFHLPQTGVWGVSTQVDAAIKRIEELTEACTKMGIENGGLTATRQAMAERLYQAGSDQAGAERRVKDLEAEVARLKAFAECQWERAERVCAEALRQAKPAGDSRAPKSA